MAAVQTAANIMQELGLLAFLILLLAVCFCFMVWRIVKTQDSILVMQDRLLAKITEHDGRSGLIQQKSELMHDTCLIHGEMLSGMKDGMNDFRARLLDRLAKVEQEVALLKTKIEGLRN